MKIFKLFSLMTIFFLKGLSVLNAQCPDQGRVYSTNFSYVKMQGHCGGSFKSYTMSIEGGHYLVNTPNFTFNRPMIIQGGLTLANNSDIKGMDSIIGYDDLKFSGNNGSTTQMYLSNAGNLGIGTTNPTRKLHVSSGQILADRAGISVVLSPDGAQNTGWVGTLSNHGLFVGTNNTGSNLYLDTSDNVFVGGKRNVSTSKLDYYDLFVNGGVLTEDIGLADVNHWPDYVFDEKYVLRPLEEMEAFIRKQKHLPNIPSASEIKKEGYKVKDMDVRFLEKIEELMLYTIQQQKEIESLKKEISNLKDKN